MEFKKEKSNQVQKKDVKMQSNVTLENKEKMIITGVTELYSSQENEIRAKTGLGNIKIMGSGLKPEKLDLENNVLSVTGEIEGISYYGANNSKSFFKRIFK